jgi:hypothetical protein
MLNRTLSTSDHNWPVRLPRKTTLPNPLHLFPWTNDDSPARNDLAKSAAIGIIRPVCKEIVGSFLRNCGEISVGQLLIDRV